MFRKILLFLCLVIPAAAQAEWHEASSRNFLVYSEGSVRDARDFAAKLERFHHVLRTVHRVTAPPPANRLRVYLFDRGGDVADMAGAPGAPIAGYYVSDARALMMIGTRSRGTGISMDVRSSRSDVPFTAEAILLHEYAHHFMFQYFPAAYPAWYREGFAEFWGATRFLPNDVIDVGLPANSRFATFRALGWMPIQRLLSAYNYSELGQEQVFLLYAQGWLVMRYVFEHPERRSQLDRYIALVNRGTSYADAAREAFPDLDRFNAELQSYASTSRFNFVRLPFRAIDVGPIETRGPGPAEQALMTAEIRLSQGIPNRRAAEFANDVRTTAARFPNDPFALRVLMEAEYLAGNHERGLAAADALLAIEPDNARALAMKGRLRVAVLRAERSTDARAWDEARRPIARARGLAPNDPIVLEAYYDGFAAQGILPPIEAQEDLFRAAMELAPSDGELRYKLALDYERRNMIADAIAAIRAEALAVPHRGDESERDRRERLIAEERWREAGQERHETAREMLVRLEARLAGADQPTATTSQPPRRE